MANSIALITEYLAELDKVYKYESKTSVLDTPMAAIKQTDNAKTIKIAKMALQGLGDYDRSTGYVEGDATLTWEDHTFTQDRARKFNVDTLDNLETANVSFGMLAAEFIRNHTVAEFDAYRMASYSAVAGNSAEADMSTGADVLAAIDAASEALDDAEVPEDGRILFISNSCYKLLKNSPDVTRFIGQGNDKAFDRQFKVFDDMEVVKMPKSRFYTAITQHDGSTAGQEAGGYIKNVAGKDINFMIIHPSAVIQLVKHTVTKIISPEQNQIRDGWAYYFRAYHDAWAYENKVNGIYLHNKTT